jgi:protein associated with RNAse G/E
MHHLASAIGPNRKVIVLEKGGRTWFVTEDAVVPTDTG